MNKRIFAVAVMACVMSSSSLLAAEKIMYKWTDDKGEVHYTERAPKGIEYTRIKTYVDSSTAVTSKPTAVEAKKEQSTEATKAYGTWREENCNSAKHNLDILKNRSRIGVDDGQGGKRLMSDEEKTEKIAQMEEQRDKYCSKEDDN